MNRDLSLPRLLIFLHRIPFELPSRYQDNMNTASVPVDPLYIALAPSPLGGTNIERFPPQQRFSQSGKTLQRRRTDIALGT